MGCGAPLPNAPACVAMARRSHAREPAAFVCISRISPTRIYFVVEM